MRFRSLKAILAASLLLITPRLRAQPGYAQESLDLVVAEADQVVVGRILKVDKEAPESNSRYAVFLAVEKTIKGDPVRRTLSIPSAYWDNLTSLSAEPRELTGEQTPSHRLLVAISHYKSGETDVKAIDLDAKDLAVAGTDGIVNPESLIHPHLVVLRSSEDVVRAAQDEVRRIPPGIKRIDTFEITAYGSHVEGTTFAGDSIALPFDERLEEYAHAALRGDRVGWPAAHRVLRHYKTDANIHTITGLLEDSEYSMRNQAYVILTEWGIHVPVPTFS